MNNLNTAVLLFSSAVSLCFAAYLTDGISPFLTIVTVFAVSGSTYHPDKRFLIYTGLFLAVFLIMPLYYSAKVLAGMLGYIS